LRQALAICINEVDHKYYVAQSARCRVLAVVFGVASMSVPIDMMYGYTYSDTNKKRYCDADSMRVTRSDHHLSSFRDLKQVK